MGEPQTEEFFGLLQRARQGDRDATGQLIDRYRSYLLAIANEDLDAGLRQKLGASDIVQETILVGQEKFDQFAGETESELLGWLRAILVNGILNQRRQYSRQKRDVGRELPISENSPSEQFFDPLATPGTQATTEETRKAIATALTGLRDDYRRVIELRIFEQLDFETIGQKMDRNSAAARKLWSRAIRTLHDKVIELSGQGRDPGRPSSEGTNSF